MARRAQPELDVAQIAAACLRRLKAPHDPLASVTRIVDDDHQRRQLLGYAAGRRAAAARQLGEFGAQVRVQAILEPGDDVAAFVWREAEAIVAAERDMHPSADE